MNAIFEAVQSALRLKFRGAGARLFFNDGYDFTESGPKVAAIVCAGFKEALGKLPPTASPPALACLGLTGKQAWFTREVQPLPQSRIGSREPESWPRSSG